MPAAGDLRVGDLIDVRFTKWGGAGHWEFPVSYLGADGHGIWGGGSIGTRLSRPGQSFESEYGWVTLFPHDQPWCASFYDSPAQQVAVYVDMTTVPVWSGARVSMVDLDLDVVLLRDGSLFVDDEDEFDEHRVQLSYPDDLVDLARMSATNVFKAITNGTEPFDFAWQRWLASVSSGAAPGRS